MLTVNEIIKYVNRLHNYRHKFFYIT